MDKSAIKEHLLELLSNKIGALSSDLEEIKQGLASDTKSTAGDKHETSRAMAHIELEKLSVQLLQLREQEAILQSIDVNYSSSIVEHGSYVKCSIGNFFISIPFGEVKGRENCFAVSPASPLIQKMLGKKVEDSIDFNGRQITITSIR